MRQEFKGKIRWINIIQPSKEDINYLKNFHSFHPLVLRELETYSQRNRAEIYNDYIFVVTHFPIWDSGKQISVPWEMDILLSKNFLITISYDPLTEAFQELLEKIYSRNFEEEYLQDTAKLLYFILEHFLIFAMRQVAHIQEKLQKIENSIFQGKHQEVIPMLSFVKRDILNFRRILRYLKEDLSSLGRQGPRLLGEETAPYFQDLIGDGLRVENIIENFKDTIESLEKTNNSYIEHRINNLTRIYTIISFTTWPTLLIISIYQMNTKVLPLVGSANDFYKIISLSLIPSFLIYLYLRQRRLI